MHLLQLLTAAMSVFIDPPDANWVAGTFAPEAHPVPLAATRHMPNFFAALRTGKKEEVFYLTTHSTHFNYGYVARITHRADS